MENPEKIMNSRQKVTLDQFRSIACNQCGACCTGLWLPSPEELTQYVETSAQVENPPQEWREENIRVVAWIAALEPTGLTNEMTHDGNTHQYSCRRFTRLEDGSGICTAYDDRPNPCRNFPYDQPVHGDGFEECSFNVDIVKQPRRGHLFSWFRARITKASGGEKLQEPERNS